MEAKLPESHPLLYPLFASGETSLGCHGVANKTFNCLFVNTPGVYLLFVLEPCNFAPLYTLSIRHFVDTDHFVLLALVTGEYSC